MTTALDHPLLPIMRWERRGPAMLTGESGTFLTAHSWIAHLALTGCRVHVVDCAMRFNVFALADFAAERDVNPDLLLSAVTVHRVFTPYHILESAKQILRGQDPGQLTFFLAPLKQFFDADVAEDEGRFLLDLFHRKIRLLASQSLPLLLVEKSGYSHPSFDFIYPKICRDVTPLWRVAPPLPSVPPLLEERTGEI